MRMLTRLGEYYDLGVAYVFREMCNCKVTPCDQAIKENNEFFAITRDAGLQQQRSWCLQYNAYHHAIKGEFTEECREKCLEANRLSTQVKDLPTIPLTIAFLAFGHLRMKQYAEAIACARQVEELIPTHQLKAAWIMDLWPICGQVYLDAIRHMPGLSEQTKAAYMDKVYYFCKEGMRRARKYGYIYGWICRNYGTYWRLRGKHNKARRYWERGIRFLRQYDARFELGSILREQAYWMLKDNPSDRQAQEQLMEAKDLFTQHDCLKDAAEVAAMLHGSSPRAVRRTREALTFKRHLESLLSVTQAIGSVFVLENLLQQIVTYAMEVTGAERGCILLNSDKTKHLELRTGRGWSREVSEKPFSYESYGISLALVEQVRQRAEARIASAKDEGELGAELGLYGVRQAMGVPLRTKEKDIGILYLDNHLADGVFGSEELELMKSFAVQATVSIENTQLVQSLLEQDRLKQEMRLGREIQQGFLPKEAPKVSGLRVSAVMDPAREIGGDYYDFILRPAVNGVSPLAIIIGDVTGKGLGAGLNMAMVKTTLLTLSEESIGLKEILAKANRILHGQMSFGTFISLLYLQWDPAGRTMSYAGAGHCEILVFRKATGSVEVIRSGGAVLGIAPEIEDKLAQNDLNLAPGDKAVLFTDGVIEAQNAAEEEFGLARLTGSLERNGGSAPDQLVNAIRRDVESFIAEAPQYDDITLIAMEID
jgi:serine phosphatase RsbU (regulator of sigma subunit)/tetratricopeptide (TPR) repeat protein